MKNKILLFTLLIIFQAFYLFASENSNYVKELRCELNYSNNDLSIRSKDGFDIVSLPDTIDTIKVGKPQLPVKVIQFAIDPDKTLSGVDIVEDEARPIEGLFNIYPAQKIRLLTEARIFTEPDSATYSSSSSYPPERVKLICQSVCHGITIVTVAVYPLEYVPAERKLILHTHIIVRLTEKLPPGQKHLRWKKEHKGTKKSLENAKLWLKRNVVNPHDVEYSLQSSPSAESTAPTQAAGMAATQTALSSEAVVNGGITGNVDYLIITNDALNGSGEFNPLINDKISRGIHVGVATVEYIYANVSGTTNQEKIRNYIQGKVNDNGVSWVLLGGDTEIVPTYFYALNNPSNPSLADYLNSTPTDLYYATADGSLISDVFIGRVPANNDSEIKTFVTKVLRYQNNIKDYYNNILFWALDDSYGRLGATNFPPLIPKNFNEVFLKQWELNGKKRTESRKTDVMNELQSQTVHYNIFNHADHAYPLGVAIGINAIPTGANPDDYMITENDFNNFKQGLDYPAIMISGGCWSAAFEIGEGEVGGMWDNGKKTALKLDVESVGELWVTNPNGGGAAYIGNTRDGNTSGGSIYYLPKQFYTQLFQGNNITGIGELVAAAKSAYVANAATDIMWRYSLYEWTLLGDPEMSIMKTDRPIQGNITVPARTSLTAVTLSLSATENGVELGYGSQMRFSNDGATWSSAEPYARSKSWAVPLGDGNKLIYVQFIDPDNNYSSFYPATTFLDTSPKNLTATPVSTSQIKLTWEDNATGETGFKIERRTESGAYALIATVSSNVTTYTNISLSNNAKYYYRVRAVYKEGNSLYSNEAGAATYPTAPSSLVAKNASSINQRGMVEREIDLSWKNNANDPNNEVSVCVEFKPAGGSYQQIAESELSGIQTYSLFGGLSYTNTYYFRVRAHNKFTGLYSAYSNEASAAPPPVRPK